MLVCVIWQVLAAFLFVASALRVQTGETEGTFVWGKDGTFSQNYQDEWMVRVARRNGWLDSGGFFLDLGAYDGLKCSNSALLEKNHDWKGICVEPFLG